MAAFTDLQPWLTPYARYLYSLAEYNRMGPRVTSTYRSYAEQARLYQQYRSGNSLLPAAPPGRSLHQYGEAFDMVVRHGQSWLGGVWEQIGGRWGGEVP